MRYHFTAKSNRFGGFALLPVILCSAQVGFTLDDLQAVA